MPGVRSFDGAANNRQRHYNLPLQLTTRYCYGRVTEADLAVVRFVKKSNDNTKSDNDERYKAQVVFRLLLGIGLPQLLSEDYSTEQSSDVVASKILKARRYERS